MKIIKPYKLFLEDKTIGISKVLKKNIERFLISQERLTGLYFNNFDIIGDDRGRMKFIIAYTKEGPKGEKSTVDSIKYDMLDYNIWKLESEYEKGNRVEFDPSHWSGKKLKTLEQLKRELEGNALGEIVWDYGRTMPEPSTDDKKLIDKIIRQTDVWNTCKKRVGEILTTIRKYNIEDIEDRLVEYTDQLIGWNEKIVLAYFHPHRNWWSPLKGNENLDDRTCRYIWTLWDELMLSGLSSYEDFLLKVSPCIRIDLNEYGTDNQEYKKLSDVEEIAHQIGNRFQKLYDVEEVIYPPRYTLQNNIKDYSFNIILK